MNLKNLLENKTSDYTPFDVANLINMEYLRS